MASFDSINYSLRPSKHIERALIFDGVRMLQKDFDCSDQIYVGFGSIWFVDFQLAHRALGIKDMRSIEADEVGYSRALFNRPFKTIEVSNQPSGEALPLLFDDEAINKRPWLIWLDYDCALNEEIIDDARSIIERAPPNSIYLLTFSATPQAYGKPNQRVERLRQLLGGIVPDGMAKETCSAENLAETLASLTTDFLVSVATAAARPGGFRPAFNVVYTDSVTMVTVGGVLPAHGAVPAIKATIGHPKWPGNVKGRIEAPHLTLREAAILQSQLPRKTKLSRKAINRLGFDLREEQIASFEKYYLHYPSFAQIMI